MHQKVREIFNSPGIVAWRRSRPPLIMGMIEKWPTASLWRRPGNSSYQYHAIFSWNEDGTISTIYFIANPNGELLMPMVDKVFGIDPDELIAVPDSEVTDAVQQLAIDLVYSETPDD